LIRSSLERLVIELDRVSTVLGTELALDLAIARELVYASYATEKNLRASASPHVSPSPSLPRC
jgi:hypothetical protein